MLNIILNDKAEEAKKSGIEMEIRIGEIRLEHIRDMDMTTIFANLLDNALEAAQQAEGTRTIQVQADTFHDFTAVKIRNSMPCGSTAGTSALPPERQAGKNHMGIGLENVRHTLEAYGGVMMTEILEGKFVVSLTIPA